MPFGHGLATGVGYVGSEACAQFLKGFFFFTEEGISRWATVLDDVVLEKALVLIARPIENNQTIVSSDSNARY